MQAVRNIMITMAVSAVLAAGCGHGTTRATAANSDRYCQLARTLAAPPTGIDPATASPEQIKVAVKSHFADHLNDIAELVRVAPAEVHADVVVYARIARHIAQTGAINEYDTPQNAPAISRQEAFDKKTCGIQPPTGP